MKLAKNVSGIKLQLLIWQKIPLNNIRDFILPKPGSDLKLL